MLLPYRVKNPPKTLPLAMLLLIFINCIIYIFTSDSLLVIKESVVKEWAFELGKLPFWTFISASFLHGDPFHLIGNMLFLYIFGPSVEDRLGRPKYLAVYMMTGLCGSLLQAGIDIALHGKATPIIGASGCIMGILGAYWYLFTWSTVCVFYFFYIFWHGVWEIQALWVIGFYFIMDLAQGLFVSTLGVSGGVANFAHIGGSLTGALFCLMLRTKRDTAEVSEAKAIQADMRDLSLMPLHVLQTMLDEDPNNPDIIRAMMKPAMGQNKPDLIHEAMSRAGVELADKDPDLVAYYLTAIRGNATIYPAAHILRMAMSKERQGDNVNSLHLYKILVENHPTASEVERALYGMAVQYWRGYKDVESARTCLAEMAKRFPNGAMTPYGKQLWQQISENRQI